MRPPAFFVRSQRKPPAILVALNTLPHRATAASFAKRFLIPATGLAALTLMLQAPAAAALPAVQDLSVRGGELVFSFSAPVYFQVSQQPDALVIDLQNTTIDAVEQQLRSLEGTWFNGLEVNKLFAGGYRLTFHLRGGPPPAVVGSSPSRTLAIEGDRGEEGRSRPSRSPGPPPDAGDQENSGEPSPALAPGDNRVLLRRLKFVPDGDRGIRLQIEATGPVHPHSFTLDDPARRRLVIDFPNCVIQPADQTLEPPENPWVSRVRTGMFEGRLPRVVLDLKRPAEHQLTLMSYPFGASLEVGNNELPAHVALTVATPGGDQLPADGAGGSPLPADLRRLAGHTIVIDPGHGGFQTGAYAWGFNEKTLTLDLGRRVYRALHDAGANVILTRSDDLMVTLSQRADIANSSHAEAFVSIHLNALDSVHKRSGTQTWFHFQNPICKSFAATMQADVCQSLGLPNLGIHSDTVRFRTGFGVLREANPTIPSVLVEVGYLDCQQDFQCLCRADFREKAARAICEGIADFVVGHTASAGSENSNAQ